MNNIFYDEQHKYMAENLIIFISLYIAVALLFFVILCSMFLVPSAPITPSPLACPVSVVPVQLIVVVSVKCSRLTMPHIENVWSQKS